MKSNKPAGNRTRQGNSQQGAKAFGNRGSAAGKPAGTRATGEPGRGGRGKPQGTPASRPAGRPFGRKPGSQEGTGRGTAGDRPMRPVNNLAYVETGRENRSAPYANRRFGPNARQQVQPAAQVSPAALDRRADTQLPQEPENLLSGRNPIREALKANRDIEKLLVAAGDLSGSAREIVSMARKAGIIVQEVERARLDQITRNHQGMVAFASAYSYSTVDEMLDLAKELQQAPFLVLLDKVTDPQNLGAIIRTAACVGAHGVVVPLHRAVGLTPSAVRASAGAVEHVKVARVVNLNQLIKDLKSKGIWVYGADAEGTDLRQASFDGPCALVIGSEGEGISEHTLALCDHRVSIPMTGVIDSLNASVAAGVLMYAVYMGGKA